VTGEATFFTLPNSMWRWTGQVMPLLESQYLTGSFYLYQSFSVIVAQPLSFTLAATKGAK
ncbi:hypothetical protein K8R14_05665, partial [bacterium]|nr:hypothetical protein [bacterium]